MTNEQIIKTLRIVLEKVEWNYPMDDYSVAIKKVINKLSDKNCSKCINKDKCAIFDNFNIDYCSDWRIAKDG